MNQSSIGALIRSSRFGFGSIVLLSLFLSATATAGKNDQSGSKSYPADVAVGWMNMQLRLTKGTTGFNSVVSNRSYAYAGLVLYESIAQGMPGYQSIASQLNGRLIIPEPDKSKKYF